MVLLPDADVTEAFLDGDRRFAAVSSPLAEVPFPTLLVNDVVRADGENALSSIRKIDGLAGGSVCIWSPAFAWSDDGGNMGDGRLFSARDSLSLVDEMFSNWPDVDFDRGRRG